MNDDPWIYNPATTHADNDDRWEDYRLRQMAGQGLQRLGTDPLEDVADGDPED